jgi:hypothetical protein
MKTLAEMGIKRLEDLQNVKENDSPYVLGSIFDSKSKVPKRILKRKLKILKGVEPFIMKALRSDEKVYYVSYGIKNSTFDHMFLGAIAHYINRKLFVFTTRRILMVKYKGKYLPSQLYSEIPYPHIAGVKSTLFGNFKLNFSDGKKDLFVGIPKPDRKFINNLFAKLKSGGVSGQETGSVINLCPHCFERVEGFPKLCHACRGKFKSAKTTSILSLIFPGIGDIYLGHRGFGAMQVAGGFFVWLSFFMPQLSANTAQAGAPSLLGAILVFTLMHGIDSAVTYTTAKKGIYPG